MQFRVRCSACGKSLLADPKSETSLAICSACGNRIEVPAAPKPNTNLTWSAPADQDYESADDIIDIGAAEPSAATPAVATSRRITSRPPPRRWLVVAGVGVLAIGGVAGFFAGQSHTPQSSESSTAAFAADEARNSDLLQLKSEAEALVLQGKLEDAHAKYRRLTLLAAGREFKGPLLWDILERAKVDQDRVYWILLARMDGAERAFGLNKPPLPGLPNTFGAPATMPSNVWSSGRPLTTPSTQRVEVSSAGVAPIVAPTTNPASNPSSPTSIQPASAPAVVTGEAYTPAALPLPQSNPVQAKVGEVLLSPASAELTVANPAVLDSGIARALRAGVEHLLSHVSDGELPAENQAMEMHRRGLHALVLYALLTTGQVVDDTRLRGGDPNIRTMLAKLKGYSLETNVNGSSRPVVYARSLRAAALSVLNRPEDRLVLKDDVSWLMDAHVGGGFSYDDRIKRFKRVLEPKAPPATQPMPPMRPPATMPGRSSVDGLLNGLPFFARGRHASDGPLLDEDGNPVVYAHGGGHDPRSGRGVVPGPTRIIIVPPRPKVSPPRVMVLPPGINVDGSPMWDNSNSQYAVLGVASGAAAGIPVPAAFWKDVRKHWFDSQLKDGQWTYRWSDKTGSLAMTAGGAASLLTVNDLLQEPGSKAFPPELERTLKWLEQGDNIVTIPGPKTHYIGYDLFGVGRVGLLSGYKYFGSHDWFRELAQMSLSLQNKDGSWGSMEGPQADRVVDTAFHMLFLARGKNAIMMNKLSWPGEWNRRPRDIANAASFLSKVTERTMNWQVVKLERAGSEWLDAPILYVASDEPPKFAETDYESVRRYVDSGGMLFLHADDASFPFGRWTQELCKKIAPEYPLIDVPADHEIYSVLFKLPPDRKRLQMVTNGSRVLALVSPYDIGRALQAGDEKKNESDFQLMANIWAYANGRNSPRPRLDTYDIPAPPQKPLVTLQIARLKYAGNWNPEPGSWARLSRYTEWESGAAVATNETELSTLQPGATVVAHLTGTADFQPGDTELAALRNYVEAGGTLLIDACGGATAFANAVEQRLLPAFPGLKMEDASMDAAPMIRTFDVGDDLRIRELRPFVTERVGVQVGKLQIGTFGKGRIVYSPLDLSTGLAGSRAWGVAGYTPDYSIGVVKNVLLWAAARPAN